MLRYVISYFFLYFLQPINLSLRMHGCYTDVSPCFLFNLLLSQDLPAGLTYKYDICTKDMLVSWLHAEHGNAHLYACMFTNYIINEPCYLIDFLSENVQTKSLIKMLAVFRKTFCHSTDEYIGTPHSCKTLDVSSFENLTEIDRDIYLPRAFV